MRLLKPSMDRSGNCDSRAKERILVRYCRGSAYRNFMDDRKRAGNTKDVRFGEESMSSKHQLKKVIRIRYFKWGSNFV